MTDPVRRAETYSVLARAQVSAGRSDEAIAAIRQALASAGLPRTWQARMLALLAMLERAGTGDLDAADVTARQARRRRDWRRIRNRPRPDRPVAEP